MLYLQCRHGPHRRVYIFSGEDTLRPVQIHRFRTAGATTTTTTKTIYMSIYTVQDHPRPGFESFCGQKRSLSESVQIPSKADRIRPL